MYFKRLVFILFFAAAHAAWNPYGLMSFTRDHNELRFEQTYTTQPSYNWKGDYSLLGPGLDVALGAARPIAPNWDLNVEASLGYSVAESSLGVSAINGLNGQVSMARNWVGSARVMPVYHKYGEIGGVFGLEAMNYKMSSNVSSFASTGNTSQLAGGFMTGITMQSPVADRWAIRMSWLETLFLKYEYDAIADYANDLSGGGQDQANIQHVSFKPTVDRFMASVVYYPYGQHKAPIINSSYRHKHNYIIFSPIKDVTEVNESQDEEQILKTFHLPLAISGWGLELTGGKRFNINENLFFGIEAFVHYLNSKEDNQGLHTDYRFQEKLEHDWDIGLVFAPGIHIGPGQNIVVQGGIARGTFTDRGPERLVQGNAIQKNAWGGVVGIRDELTLNDHWRLTLGMKAIHFQTIKIQTGGSQSLNDLDDISSGIYQIGLMYAW